MSQYTLKQCQSRPIFYAINWINGSPIINFIFMIPTLTSYFVVGSFFPRQPRRTRFRQKIPRRRRPVARKPKGVGEKTDQEEGKAEEKPDDDAPSGSKAQKRVKGKRRRRKIVRRKTWKKKDSDDDSECDSICSFDSEVCLRGTR